MAESRCTAAAPSLILALRPCARQWRKQNGGGVSLDRATYSQKRQRTSERRIRQMQVEGMEQINLDRRRFLISASWWLADWRWASGQLTAKRPQRHQDLGDQTHVKGHELSAWIEITPDNTVIDSRPDARDRQWRDDTSRDECHRGTGVRLVARQGRVLLDQPRSHGERRLQHRAFCPSSAGTAPTRCRMQQPCSWGPARASGSRLRPLHAGRFRLRRSRRRTAYSRTRRAGEACATAKSLPKPQR